MTGTRKLKAAVLILLLIAIENSVRGQQVRLLECQSTFSKDATSSDLIRRFGARNVIPSEVYVGEGYSEHGTVLFADSPEDRVEIRWKDIERQRMPNIIYVRGAKSHWRTEGGLALGLDLITVEKLNGRPFKLLGLSVDYQGTVLSWSGGRFESLASKPCEIGAVLLPKETGQEAQRLLENEVVAGDFTSSVPAMRSLNPTVVEMYLSYPDVQSSQPKRD